MKCKSASFYFSSFFIFSSYSQDRHALSDKPTLQTTATPAKSTKVQKHNPKLAIALSVVVPEQANLQKSGGKCHYLRRVGYYFLFNL